MNREDRKKTESGATAGEPEEVHARFLRLERRAILALDGEQLARWVKLHDVTYLIEDTTFQEPTGSRRGVCS